MIDCYYLTYFRRDLEIRLIVETYLLKVIWQKYLLPIGASIQFVPRQRLNVGEIYAFNCLMSLKRTETVRGEIRLFRGIMVFKMHQKPASAIVYAARLAL